MGLIDPYESLELIDPFDEPGLIDPFESELTSEPEMILGGGELGRIDAPNETGFDTSNEFSSQYLRDPIKSPDLISTELRDPFSGESLARKAFIRDPEAYIEEPPGETPLESALGAIKGTAAGAAGIGSFLAGGLTYAGTLAATRGDLDAAAFVSSEATKTLSDYIDRVLIKGETGPLGSAGAKTAQGMMEAIGTVISSPFEGWKLIGKHAGDYTFEKTGNATLSATVATILEGLPFALIEAGRFKKWGQELKGQTKFTHKYVEKVGEEFTIKNADIDNFSFTAENQPPGSTVTPEVIELFKEFGDNAAIRRAKKAGSDLKVIIPEEAVRVYADQPWFAELKESVGLKPYYEEVRSPAGEVAWETAESTIKKEFQKSGMPEAEATIAAQQTLRTGFEKMIEAPVREVARNQVPDAIQGAVEDLDAGKIDQGQLIDSVASQLDNLGTLNLDAPDLSVDVFKQAAADLGITYTGEMEGAHLFTDPHTKGTFAIQEGEDLAGALTEKRNEFYRADRALAIKALDEGFDVPADIAATHRIDHDMIGINAHLKARKITSEEHAAIIDGKRIARSFGIEPTWKEVDLKATKTSGGVPLQLDMSKETGMANREKMKADYGITEKQLQEKLDGGATYGIYAEYQNRDYARRVAADRGEGFKGPKSIFYSGARIYEYPHEDAHHFIAEGVFKLNIPEGATKAQAAAIEEQFAIEYGEGMEAAQLSGTVDAFLEAFTKKYPPQKKAKPVEKPEVFTSTRELPKRGVVTIYRGEFTGNKGGSHFSLDKEWARQFTQTGRLSEVKSRSIGVSSIYKKEPLPSATSEKEMDIAIAEARSKGFSAVLLDEGRGEPNSVFIIREVKSEPTATTGRGKEPGVPRLSTREQRVESAQGRARRSYPEAIKEKGNPWIRLTDAPSNKGRTLLVQFTTDLMGASVDKAAQLYDKQYSGVRKGYVRAEDFWEIPQWIANVKYITPNADVYVVRDMKEAKDVISSAGYDNVVFSSMDVNKGLIKELAKEFPGTVDVGGYVKAENFKGTNVRFHESLPSLAKQLGVEFKDGADYIHFKGTEIIPRLTMSRGCKYKCAFCAVTKNVEMSSAEAVDQQVESFKDLKAKLVYLNDKTFGQSRNYTDLIEVNKKLKEQNPEFEGFIIQTTASDLMKMTPEFLKESGIKYVELGIESYNDFILRGLHKPHNERVIDLATAKLRGLKINLVPNVIIGIPEETGETYQKTLDYLKKNSDIISHANIYILSLMEGTEMTQRLGVKSELDLNQNAPEKSFHTDKQIHQAFADEIYKMMEERLDKSAFSIRDEEFPRWFGGKIKDAFKKNEIAKILIEAGPIQSGPLDGGCRVLARALKRIEPTGEIVTLESKVNKRWQAEHYGFEFEGGVIDAMGFASSRKEWGDRFAEEENIFIFDRPYRVTEGELPSDEIPQDAPTEKLLASALEKELSGPAYSTRITKEVRKAMREIVAEAKSNKTYMKAPNGEGTLLNKEQWALVRTKAFKTWFGDWEAFAKKEGGVWAIGSELVSKVVDKNGEPLVVFHGTAKGGFSVFDPDMRDKHAVPATFFTDRPRMASTYSGSRSEIALLERNGEAIEAAKYSTGAAFPNKQVTLTHWTTKEGLKKASPKYYGTGSQGAEKFRQAMPVVYYGVPPYQKEAFVRGAFMYTAEADGEKIYDMEKDPLNLYPSDERMKKAGAQLTEINTRRYLYEKDIKKAGFDGYYVASRGVVAMFIPLDVEPQKAGSKALPHPKEEPKYSTTAKPEKPLVDAIRSEMGTSWAELQPLLKQYGWSDQKIAETSKIKVKNLLKAFDETPPDEVIESLAKLGEVGARWYTRAAMMLTDFFGPDAPMVARLIAATSPQNVVTENLAIAFDAYSRYKNLLKPTRKDVEKAFHNLLTTQVNIDNAVRAVMGEEIGAEEGAYKIKNFAKNLMNVLDGVTLDVWMSMIGDYYTQKPGGMLAKEFAVPGDPRYAAYAAKITRVANKLGWAPAEVQAAAWMFTKSLYEAMGKFNAEGYYLTREPTQRGWKEALNNLTEGDVVAASDLVNIILEDLRNDGKITTSLGKLGITKDTIGNLKPLESAEPGRKIAGGMDEVSRRVVGEIGRKLEGIRRQRDRETQSREIEQKRFDKPPNAFIFASENIKTGTQPEDVKKAMTSAGVKRYEVIVNELLSGIDHRSFRAMGDWTDGQETSVYSEITSDTPYDELRVAAAKMGLARNQKMVIVFKVGKGRGRLYIMDLPVKDLDELRQTLTDNKINDRTIVPRKDGNYQVIILDPKGKLEEKVKNVGRHYKIVRMKWNDTEVSKIETYQGKGEFIGADTRAEAMKEFKKVLDDAEVSFDPAQFSTRAPIEGKASERADFDIKDSEFMENMKLVSVKDFKDYLKYTLSFLNFKPTGKLTSDQRDLVASVISASLTQFKEQGGNERTIKPALEMMGFPVDDKRPLKNLVRYMTGQIKVSDLLIKETDALAVKLRAEEQAARKAMAQGKREGYEKAAIRYRLMKVLDRERKNERAEIRKMIDHMQTAEKKTPEMTPKYGEEVKKLLEPFDMATLSEKKRLSLEFLRKELRTNPDADFDIERIDELERLDKTPVRDLTFEQMKTLHDAVMHLATLGVRGPQMILGQKKIAREMVEQQSLKEMKPVKEVTEELVDIRYTKGKSFRGALLGVKNQFGIHSISWDALVESVTGMDSLYYQIMYREIKSGIKERDRLNYELEDGFMTELEGFQERHGIKDIPDWLEEAQDIKTPDGTIRMNRNQKLSFYRGFQDPDWRRAVEEGGFGLWADPHKSNPNRVFRIGKDGVQNIIDSMTGAERDYAEAAVPNIIKSGKLIADKFLEINGYAMPMPESGIYWRKDVMGTERGAEDQAELDKQQFARPGIFKGMTKQRVKSKAAVWLKPFTVAMGEMHKRAADYTALEEPMSNAAWLHYKTRAQFEERYGLGLFKEIEKGLKDISEVYPMEMETFADASFRKIRNHNTIYALALNYGTMLKQLNGPFNYMVFIPPSYLAWAAGKYIQNPREVRRLHREMSVQYRKRAAEGYTQDIGNVLSGLSQYGMRPGPIQRFGATGLMPLRQVDLFGVDLGMLAAVEQALRSFETTMPDNMRRALGITDAEVKKMTHGERMKKAYEWADWTTERTQAQAVPEHMSGWQRGAEIEKQFSMFFSEIQKNISGIYRAASAMKRGDPGATSLMIRTLFFYIVLGSIVFDTGVDILRAKIRGQKPDYLWARVIKNLAGMVPVVRDIVQTIVDSMQGKFFPSGGDTPAARVQQAIVKPTAAATKYFKAKSRRDREKAAWGTANAAADLFSMALGIPYPGMKEIPRIMDREETKRRQRRN